MRCALCAGPWASAAHGGRGGVGPRRRALCFDWPPRDAGRGGRSRRGQGGQAKAQRQGGEQQGKGRNARASGGSFQGGRHGCAWEHAPGSRAAGSASGLRGVPRTARVRAHASQARPRAPAGAARGAPGTLLDLSRDSARRVKGRVWCPQGPAMRVRCALEPGRTRRNALPLFPRVRLKRLGRRREGLRRRRSEAMCACCSAALAPSTFTPSTWPR